MSLQAYQKEIDDLMQGYKNPYWTPLSQLARLTEEVGELARIYNHKYGQKLKKSSEEADDMAGELGDILFAIICMANSEGINLDEAFRSVMTKVLTRDVDRFEKKDVQAG